METNVPVRTLGCMEEYVWLLEQHSTRMALTCIEIDGVTTLSQWETALHFLQRKYANISLRVGKDHRERPFFFKSFDEGIPLRHLPLTDETDVLEECRHDMEHSFQDGSGPPLRVTLLLGKRRAVVILSAHHAFFDGIGLMNLIRDMLSSFAEQSEPLPLAPAPSIDALVGIPVPEDYISRRDADEDLVSKSAEKDTSHGLSVPPKVSRIQLSRELTKAIVECGRLQGTTANGILMASVLEIGRAVSERWRKKDVTCVVPVNVRSLFRQERAEGIIFGQKRFVFDLRQPNDFWDIARACSEGVKEIRTVKGLVANLTPLHDFLAAERSVAEAVSLASAHSHDLMISNFGNFPGPTEFGSIRLRAVTPIVDSGDANTQTVMVATTSDVMSIVLVSPNPFPDLLPNLEKQLTHVFLSNTASVQEH